MTKLLDRIGIINVTSQNVDEAGVYCIRNKKSPGYNKKIKWLKNKINKGLKIKIVIDEQGKQLGFIEFMPSENAWRPINSRNYYYIQCIALFGKDTRNKLVGSTLLEHCEREAKQNKKLGICTLTSDGPWIATKKLYQKNGYLIAARLGRFELMYKPFSDKSPIPQLNDWTKQQQKYQGWNLIYSDQCPWHDKSVTDIKMSAIKNGIKLKVIKLSTPKEAQNAPSGFGTYTLIKDGELLADHYISKTRFENILKQENYYRQKYE